MKMRHLITGLFVSALVLGACEDPDELVMSGSENMQTLTVKGRLVSDENVEYDAVVDEAAGIITVQVPYYISDTEAVQGDLTAMKVRGSLPYGTRFEPGLSGIHDLAAGIERTLVSDVDGSSRHYTINAVYVKSDQAFATRVSLADMPNAVVSIEEPETEDGTGSITVYKTSSSIDGALKAATVTVSPWATIECRAMNGDGTIDLSEFPDIVVVSQDGSVRKTYKTAVDLPSFVPSGKAGYIASLFGFQILENNEYGFEAENNRTLAVVGDYLIVGNSGDASKMVVMNRFTGKPTGLSVNATGISRSIHAITSDSAGHLVAVAYTNSSTLPDFEVWVWKNGIGDAPTLIFSKSLPSDPYFAPLRSANPGTTTYDIGRMVDVIGDVTSGEAIIGTSCIQKIRSVFIPLADGVASTATAVVEFRSNSLASMWYTTKPVLFSMGDDNLSPGYVYGSGNERRMVTYVPANGISATQFTVPTTHFWLTDKITGVDCIDFNGMRLIGIQNCHKDNASGIKSARLYVADIADPAAGALISGFLFDSREGNLTTGTADIPGTGYSPTGMTSSYPFVSGDVVLGANGNGTGDVAFGASEDGNAVQAYMLTTDNGILAYEITRYDI